MISLILVPSLFTGTITSTETAEEEVEVDGGRQTKYRTAEEEIEDNFENWENYLVSAFIRNKGEGGLGRQFQAIRCFLSGEKTPLKSDGYIFLRGTNTKTKPRGEGTSSWKKGFI